MKKKKYLLSPPPQLYSHGAQRVHLKISVALASNSRPFGMANLVKGILLILCMAVPGHAGTHDLIVSHAGDTY